MCYLAVESFITIYEHSFPSTIRNPLTVQPLGTQDAQEASDVRWQAVGLYRASSNRPEPKNDGIAKRVHNVTISRVAIMPGFLRKSKPTLLTKRFTRLKRIYPAIPWEVDSFLKSPSPSAAATCQSFPARI